MKVLQDFESGPHKAVSFLVEREKQIQEWNEQKLPKVLPGYSGRRLPGRSTKEAGKEKGKEKEKDENGEGRIRNAIAQQVVEGIKGKACAHEDAKSTARRKVGQKTKKRTKKKTGKKEDQMEVQRAEDEKLEEVLERRRVEGSSLQAEVTQKVPELVVLERRSQGTKVIEGSSSRKHCCAR